MSSSLSPPHGGYRELKSFQHAESVYDSMVKFCNRSSTSSLELTIRWSKLLEAVGETSLKEGKRLYKTRITARGRQ